MSKFSKIMKWDKENRQALEDDLIDDDAPESGDSDGDFIPPMDEDVDTEEEDD